MSNTSRVAEGVPSGGQFATVSKPEAAQVSLHAGAPAETLGRIANTDRDPRNIPWPAKPANSHVEVNVDDEAVRQVLENAGHDGDVVDDYQSVYAILDLVEDKNADFYGVDTQGKETLLALGIRDYERAVDPYNHDTLSYREGFTNPMPAYLAEMEAVEAERLAAAQQVLEDAGVELVDNDVRRGDFWLKSEHGRLGVKIRDFGTAELSETRNWHTATPEHLQEFLGGEINSEVPALLTTVVTLASRERRSASYR